MQRAQGNVAVIGRHHAALLAFFSCADGGFCTGMGFPVDGGWSVNGRDI
jgi:hypothetical protein